MDNFPFLEILLSLGLAVYWTNAFFVIYHLTRFGVGPKPKILALVFFAGSFALFGVVAVLYSRTDLAGAFSMLFERIISAGSGLLPF